MVEHSLVDIYLPVCADRSLAEPVSRIQLRKTGWYLPTYLSVGIEVWLNLPVESKYRPDEPAINCQHPYAADYLRNYFPGFFHSIKN